MPTGDVILYVAKLLRKSSYVPPKRAPKGVFLCFEFVIRDLYLAECVCACEQCGVLWGLLCISRKGN